MKLKYKRTRDSIMLISFYRMMELLNSFRFKPVKLIRWIPLIAVSLCYIWLTTGTWIITPDSVTYVEGARSLAKFHGYTDHLGKPLTFFPPGTSIVYALAALIPREDYLIFNLLTKILVISYLFFAYRLISERYGVALGLIAFLFLSFSIILLWESMRLLSDVLFSFLFIATIYFFPPEKLESANRSRLILLGGFITFCYYVRTHGFFVLCGYMLYVSCFLKSNRKRVLLTVSLVFLLGVSALEIRNRIYPTRWSYSKLMLLKQPWEPDSGRVGWSDFREQTLTRTKAALTIICTSLTNTRIITWRGIVLFTIVTAGIAFSSKDRYSLFLLSFLPFHFVGLVLTDNQEYRYLLPILPILLMLFLKGFSGLYDLLPTGKIRAVAAIGIAFLVVVNPYWKEGYTYSQYVKGLSQPEGNVLFGNEDFQTLVEEHNHSLLKDDVIATNHPMVLRYVVPSNVGLRYFLLSRNAEKVYEDLCNQKVTYVYVDSRSAAFHVQGAIDAYPSDFLLISKNNGGALYKTSFRQSCSVPLTAKS